MPRSVLIAASEHLAVLQQHADLTDAEVFTDADALKALQSIAQHRPEFVALGKTFAASARGAAFINRIKADPALASLDIRIVEPDASYARPVARPAAAATSGGSTAVAVAVEPAPSSTGGDKNAERRGERFDVTKKIEVLIDGNPATLINISVVGAQVLSLSTLRPNQRVRMSLLEMDRPIRFNGVIAWAAYEMPKEGPRYRAGIDFYDASPEVVFRFIDSVMR